jgi:hypothetical protein
MLFFTKIVFQGSFDPSKMKQFQKWKKSYRFEVICRNIWEVVYLCMRMVKIYVRLNVNRMYL